MSTRASSTRKAASGTGKSSKTSRASRKRSGAKTAQASAATTAVAKDATAPEVKVAADLTLAKKAKRVEKTTAKPTSGSAPAVPVAKTVDPVVVSEVKPVVAGAALRKKDLIETVAERSGVKRRDAKAALEAALELLGEAIAEGRSINLPGFGKLKVTRTKQLTNGKVFMTRIRQPNDTGGTGGGASGENGDESGPAAGKDPLAEAAE